MKLQSDDKKEPTYVQGKELFKEPVSNSIFQFCKSETSILRLKEKLTHTTYLCETESNETQTQLIG